MTPRRWVAASSPDEPAAPRLARYRKRVSEERRFDKKVRSGGWSSSLRAHRVQAADEAERNMRSRRTPQLAPSSLEAGQPGAACAEEAGASAGEPSTIEVTVARHVPQPLPAPVLDITSAAVETPLATSSRISLSDTAAQMQTYIPDLTRPALLMLRIAFNFAASSKKPGSAACSGRRSQGFRGSSGG